MMIHAELDGSNGLIIVLYTGEVDESLNLEAGLR